MAHRRFGGASTGSSVSTRLETMVLMSGMDLPVRAIREQIASAVNLIIQQTRFADLVKQGAMGGGG